MAELSQKLPPGHWHNQAQPINEGRCQQVDTDGVQTKAHDPCDSFMDEMDRELVSLRALPKDKVWKTSAGDGYAFYYVRSEEPLVLSHVPFSDRWHAHPALLRGLNLEDVRQHVETERRIGQLFQNRAG